ncbi:MAG: rhodanese-related sulfurtransferase [Bacteroidetes bacterium]|nr:rhodanese-related sulfurtransferase [Bacteroidota bacterium]MBS1932224.1 rhodanese-related sulfurtransferase [Bacteroidota bacterium]
MKPLHNRISNKELKQQLSEEKEPRTTISFYCYFKVDAPKLFRDELYRALQSLKVFGRIYVAHEGINAQVSVLKANFEAFKTYLYSIKPLHGLRLNIAVDDDGKSFWVLKVKLREKIVADGITDPSFDMFKKGNYVNAAALNRLVGNPDTVLIDMRNHYEYEVGHFKNAIEIPSDTFRQQLPMAVEMMKDKKEANIIMYCTGGIRCEKASAWMMHNGFKNVFHLEGGIINYVREIKELGLESKFIGKNFVFDERLGERITNDIISKCHQCGKPADTHVNCLNEGCHLLFIQCDECRVKFEGCCSRECQDTIHLPLEEQKMIRKGIDKGKNIFNKSKARLQPLLRRNH